MSQSANNNNTRNELERLWARRRNRPRWVCVVGPGRTKALAVLQTLYDSAAGCGFDTTVCYHARSCGLRMRPGEQLVARVAGESSPVLRDLAENWIEDDREKLLVVSGVRVPAPKNGTMSSLFHLCTDHTHLGTTVYQWARSMEDVFGTGKNNFNASDQLRCVERWLFTAAAPVAFSRQDENAKWRVCGRLCGDTDEHRALFRRHCAAMSENPALLVSVRWNRPPELIELAQAADGLGRAGAP